MTTNLTSKEAKMGKVMRHTLGASLNIRHNLSSSKGPKPLQLKLLPPTYQRRAPLRLPLVPRNGCGRPGRAPERFLPLDITSLLLHVIFDARFLLRQKLCAEGVKIGRAVQQKCRDRDLHSFPTRRSSALASARTFFTFRHYITPSARNY